MERRQIVRARHGVVHHRAGHELALFVIDRAFQQRLADALRDAAMHLAFDDHRIDDGAEIIDRGPIHDLGLAGFDIDLDFADVAAGREREIGRIVERGFLQARLEFGAGEFVRDIGVERDIAESSRFVGAGDRELAVLELDIAFRRFQHEGGDFLGLGLDLVERLDDRRHADRAGARAIGAHAELHLVGIAVHDRNVLERNAKPLRHQLREGRLVALAVRMAAGEHFHGAGRVDPHFGGFPQADAGAERADRLADGAMPQASI